MNARSAAAATVAVVLATSLASGPLLSLVDLTGERDFSGVGLGEGRATLGDVTIPDGVRIEEGDFGAGTYYLRVPAATVDVREVVGRPILSYEVSVPALGFTRSAIVFLSGPSEGRVELTMNEAAFGREKITNESYRGQLSVEVRYGGTSHLVERKNVTIEVVG